MMNRMAVFHQNSGIIEKSTPSALVLMEHGYNTPHTIIHNRTLDPSCPNTLFESSYVKDRCLVRYLLWTPRELFEKFCSNFWFSSTALLYGVHRTDMRSSSPSSTPSSSSQSPTTISIFYGELAWHHQPLYIFVPWVSRTCSTSCWNRISVCVASPPRPSNHHHIRGCSLWQQKLGVSGRPEEDEGGPDPPHRLVSNCQHLADIFGLKFRVIPRSRCIWYYSINAMDS